MAAGWWVVQIRDKGEWVSMRPEGGRVTRFPSRKRAMAGVMQTYPEKVAEAARAADPGVRVIEMTPRANHTYATLYLTKLLNRRLSTCPTCEAPEERLEPVTRYGRPTGEGLCRECYRRWQVLFFPMEHEEAG